jgi:alpha-tubulin suppressor-like RCC1 family protein
LFLPFFFIGQLGVKDLANEKSNKIIAKMEKNVKFIHLGRYTTYILKENGSLFGFGNKTK